jgi:transcriptional regulator with XRE-family HTH domain
VDNREQYETFSSAVLAELSGAIKAAGMNVTALAKRIDMDYNTLRRYINGEREIPMVVLYAVIDQLPIDEAELFKRARARFER